MKAFFLKIILNRYNSRLTALENKIVSNGNEIKNLQHEAKRLRTRSVNQIAAEWYKNYNYEDACEDINYFAEKNVKLFQKVEKIKVKCDKLNKNVSVVC